MNRPAIAIHGGAGTILRSMVTEEKERNYKDSLSRSLMLGWNVIAGGGSSLDAVTISVQAMENDPLFNAGKGSVFTNAGTHEMDASVMDGAELKAGATSLISKVKNPVLLARLIMEKSQHILLCSDHAEGLAKINGLDLENEEYFYTQERFDQLQKAIEKDKLMLDHSADEGFGTVGAVAVDMKGNLAAATSTGGMTNKKPGRVGDSAIIGAGTYANNLTCAVSCTGQGEFFMRALTAYEVSSLIMNSGHSLSEACDRAIHSTLKALGGKGGLVAIDAMGNVSMPFNSEGMYRGYMNSKLKAPFIRIFEN